MVKKLTLSKQALNNLDDIISNMSEFTGSAMSGIKLADGFLKNLIFSATSQKQVKR